MGEVTEMMEEGILCQQCGVYLNIDQEYEKDDAKFEGTGTWTTCKTCREQA